MIKTLEQYVKFYFNKLFSAKYKLDGKCKQCGACCRNIVFMIDENYVTTESQFEALKKFDKKYNHFEINGKDDKGVLLFKCKSLTPNNKCKDYLFRSLYCRAYPFVTEKIRLGGCETFETCGFNIKINKNFKDYLK